MHTVQSRFIRFSLILMIGFVAVQLSSIDGSVSSAEPIAVAGVTQDATPSPAASTPTATATPISAAGTVTPVPLGSWVRWPDWPTDDLDYQDVELRDVYFPTMDEGWAVGFASDPPWHDEIALILHYRDGQWSVDESLPEADRTDMRLYAIDGTSRDDIWAVGKDRERFPPREIVAAMLHYDGERWNKTNVESIYPPQAGRAVLNDVDMVVGEDGVEGWTISQRDERGRGYVLHFVNGTWERQWEINGQDLLTIDMVDATDGWIIGSNKDGIGYWHWYNQGHWQGGSSWTGKMFGVSMADPLYGWTVGPKLSATTYLGVCHDPSEPGCQWYLYSGVRPSGRATTIDLYDIQLMSRHDGWVVGSRYDVSSALIHFEQLSRDVSSRSSVTWTLMEIENDPKKNLYAVYMLPGPDGWAVDGWAVGDDGVILHYEGPAQPATPTPTSTATPTNTATATPTPSTTPTVVPSATASPSPSPTPSPTQEHSQTRIHLPLIARNISHGP